MLAYPPDPDEPITVVCAATYIADLIPAYAFVFRVDSTRTRFTVYASDPDLYAINGTYTLTIAEPDDVPLRMSTDEWRFLRHCLLTVEQQWRDGIAQADAGATQPARDRPAEPDHLNVAPTPAGYQAIGQAFRDELDRVQQLGRRLDQLFGATHLHRDGGQP
jgi:hypothetical protein